MIVILFEPGHFRHSDLLSDEQRCTSDNAMDEHCSTDGKGQRGERTTKNLQTIKIKRNQIKNTFKVITNTVVDGSRFTAHTQICFD